ncbi:hypothetical protein M2337_003405 [Sphingobium sp. B2D3A]|uniref:hypothetical protein n=1 Tax=unclassified Sphingobium TaxID=2611147 RepID=UPI00222574BF|nr:MULTISPECIES: hypothetical protein [unclassified Sphingobium]MCW2339115.1 hypothetical protein [Sphingobium sp. B2D3A]MCW2386942.1 hypothetical protein [Sphingobium sp. B2D3D]
MTYEDFRAALAALCPVHRAKAIVSAIEALPMGTRIGSYVREAGRDRWRLEYNSTKWRRDRTSYVVQSRSYTGAWSLALDFAMPAPHRNDDAELIALAAYGIFQANGLTALPGITESAPPALASLPVPPADMPSPTRQPAPAPRIGQQFHLPW